METQFIKYDTAWQRTAYARRCAERQRRLIKKRRRAVFATALAVLIIIVLLVAFRPSASTQKASYGLPVNIGGNESKELSASEKLEVIHSSDAYPEALQELADKNAEAIDYAFNYPEYKDTAWDIDLSAEASCGTVPLLMQWDKRWGYKQYGEGLVGYTGCGPTCLSMAVIYLTGDAAQNPAVVSAFAEERGYCVPGSGSSWTLISEGCTAFGLSARELPLSQSVMENALDEGTPIIVVLGEGDFSDSGHFIVITGYNGEGFTINDPNSREKSAKTWSYDSLSWQIRNLWAMSAV